MIKLVDADDPTAMYIIGGYCANGMRGIQQNYTKALELYHRAGDLGHVAASNSTGYAGN